MYKRVAAVVIAGLLLAACAAPAAAPKAAEAPAPEAPAAEAPAAEAPAEIVTVTYTYPNSIFKDVGLVEEALNKLLEPKINTRIKLNPIDWGAFDEKMKLASAAGEECDIVFTAPWINNYIQNIANGNFVPLDDLLLQYAPGLWKSMPPTTWDAARVGGKIYGVINQQIFVKPFGFYVRQDLADKYKLDVTSIKTHAELEPFIKAVKEGEPDIMPLGGTGQWTNETAGFDPIVSEQVPIAIRFDDPDRKVFNTALTPEFKASADLAYKWMQAGYAPKEALPDAQEAWNAGKFAIAGLSGVVKPGGDIESFQRSGGVWKVYAQSVTQPFLTTAGTTATTNAICRTSKHPDRAMMVLEMLNTDVEVYNTLAKGIEGRHWEWADKENLVIKPGPNNDDYKPNTDWEFGNQFLAYYIDPEQAKQKVWDATYKLNNESPVSVAMGFNFNPEPVKTELATVSAVYGELAPPILNGQVDPATALPELQKRLDEAGIQKVIDETQKQLNEWAAAKK
jgi:putative aldouronate transport system substrate-binding protein